jgi:hypothetical protein
MEFPRDINNLISSKLDIDTRRALGIYTKLRCPNHLKEKLTKTFNRIQHQYDHFSMEIGPMRTLGDMKVPMYTIIKFFDTEGMWDHRVDYVPQNDCTYMVIYMITM